MTSATTTSPGYDLVLLAHVLSAVVGLVALGVAAGSALALRGVLRRGAPVPEALARYYRPGVNWAGRVLFLVPVFGVALLVMSDGQWGFGDTWVTLGMAVWAGVAVLAEAALWPDERRLQDMVASIPAGAGAAAVAVGRPHDGVTGSTDGSPGPNDGAVVPGEVAVAPDLDEAVARCGRVGVLGISLGTALVVIFVVMVGKP